MRAIKTTTISILAVGLLAGSTVGVAAQDEEAVSEVISFTGSFGTEGEDLPVETMSVDLPNGFSEGTPGFAWQTSWVSSDPRLTGDVRVVSNWVLDPNGFSPWETGDQANILISSAWELTNDVGSWLGEGTGFASTELDLTTGSVFLVGQDGYEGLTAAVLIDDRPFPARFRGVVFPTALPQLAELPAE